MGFKYGMRPVHPGEVLREGLSEAAEDERERPGQAARCARLSD